MHIITMRTALARSTHANMVTQGLGGARPARLVAVRGDAERRPRLPRVPHLDAAVAAAADKHVCMRGVPAQPGAHWWAWRSRATRA